ncbi:MAG: chitin-binding protein [Acinetobacter sp.]|nr:chitin-binding protein [Acinetobacter sp.]
MKPANPTVHNVPLPERTGYHVLLAVWEVADTGNAFYQVVDLEFAAIENPVVGPSTPANLTAGDIKEKSVKLTWDRSDGNAPVAKYCITRNGITTIDVAAPNLEWVDYSVSPDTRYTYFIHAVDVLGGVSAPSRAIGIITPPVGGTSAPPTEPGHLHSMKETANSVSLMWSPSNSAVGVAKYVVYREGSEIARISGNQTTYDDATLASDTQYRFFVAALDRNDRLSVPSNVLTVRTKPDVGDDYPAWKLSGAYKAKDIIRHNGQIWVCLQSHIAYAEAWAPGASDSVTLWQAYAGNIKQRCL